MDLIAESGEREKGYPTLDEYRRGRRAFLKKAGAAAMVLGLGSPLVMSVLGEEAEKKVEEKAKEFSEEDLSKMVAALAVKLGDDDFAVRKNSTCKLISLGKGEKESEKVAKQAREIVVEAMELKQKDDDPEVKERAKAVILALTKKTVEAPPGQQMELDGDVAVGF